jgi:hypothetical protein
LAPPIVLVLVLVLVLDPRPKRSRAEIAEMSSFSAPQRLRGKILAEIENFSR